MTVVPSIRFRGFSIVEVIVGAALVALVVTAIASAWQFYEKLVGQSARLAQADLLIEEGAEALQYWRDKGWTANISTLSTGTTYYIIWSGSDYVSTTTPAASGSYVRMVSFSAVYRDASSNIASSGTLDPNTRLATITISPSVSATTTVVAQAQTLVHNVFNN